MRTQMSGSTEDPPPTPSTSRLQFSVRAILFLCLPNELIDRRDESGSSGRIGWITLYSVVGVLWLTPSLVFAGEAIAARKDVSRIVFSILGSLLGSLGLAVQAFIFYRCQNGIVKKTKKFIGLIQRAFVWVRGVLAAMVIRGRDRTIAMRAAVVRVWAVLRVGFARTREVVSECC